MESSCNVRPSVVRQQYCEIKFVRTSWMTGMWLNIALIAVILHQCYCMDIDCNNMFPESPYRYVECHEEETESQTIGVTCDVDAANIKWTVTNTASGTLSVEFGLMPQSCGCMSYKLDLYIYESVTNAEECEKNNSFLSLHSSRSLEVLNHDAKRNREVSPCGKTAVATFNYVFSGCYMLDIEVETTHMGQIFNGSEPRFIRTEYKKNLLIDKEPSIISQYIRTRQEIDVSVQFQSVEGLEDLHIGLRLISDIDQAMERACYVSGHDHSCCIYRTSGQFMCKTKNVSNEPSCRVVNGIIKCTIHNITTGFYCLLVEIDDDRCEMGTVWNNKSSCTYNSKMITVPPALPQGVGTLPPERSPAASDAVLVVVVLAVVMVCVCVLVLIYRRRRRKRSLDSGRSCPGKKALPRRPQILLLYARDCELFMNMMTTLRQVLKEVTACEVYDCFDPAASEELCQNKTDWLLTRIRSPDVKVVLVESKCAALQQMALTQHMKVIYKDPTWLDDLFLYGLRLLLEDVQMNVYERVFVVRIHDFTEENDNLCITPFTRYVVPQNTEMLLSCLYQESASEHVLIVKEDSDNSWQKLQDAIRKLQVFKQQNGDYLNKLFETVMKECV